MQPKRPFSRAHFPENFNKPGLFLGPPGAFWGIARGTKVTIFYKTGAFSAFFAAISGSSEDDFRHRRDGHFFARDGHYDSNDHREHWNDGFRVVGNFSFSPPLSPRSPHRQITEAPQPLVRCRNTENVYLYNIGKIFTM